MNKERARPIERRAQGIKRCAPAQKARARRKGVKAAPSRITCPGHLRTHPDQAPPHPRLPGYRPQSIFLLKFAKAGGVRSRRVRDSSCDRTEGMFMIIAVVVSLLSAAPPSTLLLVGPCYLGGPTCAAASVVWVGNDVGGIREVCVQIAPGCPTVCTEVKSNSRDIVKVCCGSCCMDLRSCIGYYWSDVTDCSQICVIVY